MKDSLMIFGLMIGLFVNAQRAPASSAPAPARAPVKLRYLSQPGVRLNYRMTIHDETHWKASGKIHKNGQAQIDYELTGEPAPAGCFSRWSVQMNRIESAAPEKKETETNPDKLFHMMERAALHASLDAYRFSFCISEHGSFSKLQTQRDVPELPPDADEKTVVSWMFEGNYEGFILSNYLLPMINSLFPKFPDQPTGIGTSWHDADRIHSDGLIGVAVEQRTLTLQGRTAEMLSVDYISKLNALKNDAATSGLQMTVNGEGKGTLVFDAATNMVNRGEYTLTRHQKNHSLTALAQALKENQSGKNDLTGKEIQADDYDEIRKIHIERR